MPYNEDEQRKLDEARRKAEEEEARRLEEEVSRRMGALRKLRPRTSPPSPSDEDEEHLLLKKEVPRITEEQTRAEKESLIEKAIQSGGKRKLAAIMFTDIMGFSRKMGANEAAAMELLKFHNTTMEYLAVKHGGTVIKSIGDSFMVDFSSAVNAVRCAIDAQETFWKYNQGKSELDQVQIRIGIHIGDVITLGNDIFGDGVNIASRIEAITVPGRICISQDVYNQIKNKMSITAVSAGSVQLKNIDEPIEVYEILIDTIPELAKPSPLVQEALSKKEQEERARREAEEAEIAAALKKKMEEELHKKEEEIRKRREEEERRRREEEERRRRFEEEERKRMEEEERQRREEEERQKVRKALKAAEKHLARNEFAKALENVQSILANDPTNTEALAMDERIRSAQSAYEAEQAQKAQPQIPRPRPQEALQPEGLAPPTHEPLVPPKESRPRMKFPTGAVLGTLGVMAAIAVGIIVFQLTRTLFEGDRYVAVLPLTGESGAEEETRLGAALSHEIASQLSLASNARILGSATAFHVNRSSRDPRTRANAMGFPFVVTGSLSLSENSASVNLEIIDSVGGRVWSGTIEKRRQELRELVGEIAMTVADQLEIALPTTIAPATAKVSAYIPYLRGREMLMSSRDGRRSAVHLFQQALEEDPQFAEAGVAAALTLAHLYEFRQENNRDLLTEAEALAKKAMTSRPMLLEGHLAMGALALLQGRYTDAQSFLEKAREISPSNSEALRLLAIVYALGNNKSKSLENINRADDLDPSNSDVLTTAGLLHQRFGKPKEAMAYFDRALPLIEDTSRYLAETAGNTLVAAYQYDRAIALYERQVSLAPGRYVDHYKLARAHQLAGKPLAVWSKAFEKTISLIRQELQANPHDAVATAYLGLALSRYGQYEEGAESARRAMNLASANPVVLYKVADIYSIQKKKEEALKALDDAIRVRFLLEEVVDLDLFNISEEPEFLRVISPMLE